MAFCAAGPASTTVTSKNRGTSSHQPLRLRSCNLRTVTPILAGNSKSPRIKFSVAATFGGNNQKKELAILARIINNANHQYSERDARPENLKRYFGPRHVKMLCLNVMAKILPYLSCICLH